MVKGWPAAASRPAGQSLLPQPQLARRVLAWQAVVASLAGHPPAVKLTVPSGLKLLGLIGAVAFASPVARAQTYVLGSPDATLDNEAWSLSSAYLSGFRAAITNPANFGSGGTVGTTISITDLSAAAPDNLTGLNGFMSAWWDNAQSTPNVSAVVSAFRSGMDLWLLEDDTSHNAIGAALGLVQSPADGTVSNGYAPFFNGPFGTATNTGTYGNFAQFDEATIVALGGIVAGRNTSGQVTIVYWPRGTFALGAGALLVFSDVDMISSYGVNPFSPSINSNGILALNSAAWLVEGGQFQAVPEPGILPLLAAGGVLLLVWSRRKG